jgi:hypothetical protein
VAVFVRTGMVEKSLGFLMHSQYLKSLIWRQNTGKAPI